MSTPAPPVKTFADGAPTSGRGSDEERRFQWFTPRKRRASLYEDVTIDSQPSIHRHIQRGWLVSFEDGRGTWWDSSTALKSVDWFDFRDPGELWERPYYQQGTHHEHQVEGTVAAAADDLLFEDFSPEWVEFLRTHLQVPAYLEHGLWYASASMARNCLSDSLTTCMALYAGMKQRSAQAIVLYAMDLEPHLGSFPIETARGHWLNDAPWQPSRRYVERLANLIDWGELIVATLCFELTVVTLLRRELGIRAASANGDTVTPVLAGAATKEWHWTRDWMVEFLRFVTEDKEHGEHNRGLLTGWVAKWLPDAAQAATDLGAIASQLPRGIPYETALGKGRQDVEEVLAKAGLLPVMSR
jgi:hypothetical protein